MDHVLEALYDSERSGGPGRLVAERGALARRHPQVLPHVGRARDAAGRAGAAQPDADAPGAGDAGAGRARRASGGDAALAEPRDPRRRRRRRRGRSCARWSTSWSASCANPMLAGGARQPEPRHAHQPSPRQRDRLAPHHPRQPEELPARPQDDHRREARRLRPQALLAARHRALRRPERLDGHVGRLLGHLRRGAGLDCAPSGRAWSSSTPPSWT